MPQEDGISITALLEEITQINELGGLMAFVDQAELEADDYADQFYALDPKPGDIVDLRNAMEHYYVSGRLAQEGFQNLARLFGTAREYYQDESFQEHSKDFWNNRDGRIEGTATANVPDNKTQLAQNGWNKMGDVNSNGIIDEGSELVSDPDGDYETDGVMDYQTPMYTPLLGADVLMEDIVGAQLGALADIVYNQIPGAIHDVANTVSSWFNDAATNPPPESNNPPPSTFFPLNLIYDLYNWLWPKSPLVLDADLTAPLTGPGDIGYVDLSALGDTGTYFDMDGDGQAELTAWATGGDGFLARDLNANGRIDDGTELFGTAGGAEDGFAALRELDSNGDGKITDADTAWGELSVWIDANMDAVTQDGELHTLSDIGIVSIALNATLLTGVEISGNQITHSSTFTTEDGQVYGILDAWFDYDPAVTRNTEDYAFDLRAAFLPTLRGFGEIKDLHIAASIDNAGTGNLMDMLSDLALSISGPAGAFGDWADIKTDVEALLLKWAGVDGVDPDSRGVHVDARHLEFYEAFTGTPFTQYGQPDPLIEAGAFLEAMFDYIVTYSTTQIVAQVIGADVFETAPTYSLFTGAMEGDFVLSQTALDAITAEAVSSGDAVGVWTQFAQFLGYVEGLDNIGASDLAALDTAVAATSDPLLDDWTDVVTRMTATLGGIIDSADDWGSFEVIYDNKIFGTSSSETLNGLDSSNDWIIASGGNDTVSGLSGHDKLDGGSGNDTLSGGAGDDYLVGGSGNDIFIYDGGTDTFADSTGTDEIRVAASTGLTTANIAEIFRTGNNLVVQLDTGILLTIDGHFTSSSNRIETIKFLADNSSENLTALSDLNTYGGAGNDSISATTLAGSNVLYGNGGNDTITGGSGDDFLYGGTGTDSLQGDDGDDILDGGSGDDQLIGGLGDDTYNVGLGNDVIGDDGGIDTLVFAPGITAADITLHKDGNFNLHINWQGNEIVVYAHFGELTPFGFYQEPVAGREIEWLSFSDATSIDLTATQVVTSVEGYESYSLSEGIHGTLNPNLIQDDIIYGTPFEESIHGYAGDDIMFGGGGDDIYDLPIGHDTIDDQEGANTFIIETYVAYYPLNSGISHFIQVSKDIHEMKSEVSGQDVTLTFLDTGDSVTLVNQLPASGTPAISSLISQLYDYVLDFSGIEYWIQGADDNATLELVSGDQGGIVRDDLLWGHGGDDHIQALAGNDIVYAGSENDIVDAGTGDDTVYGGDDEDTLNGNENDDLLYGEFGDDTINGGDGDDTLWGGYGADTLYGGDGADIIRASDPNAGIDNDGGMPTLEDTDANTLIGGLDLDFLYGSEGNDVLVGDELDGTGDEGDVIEAGGGDDLLIGGVDGDWLDGGEGIDTVDYSDAPVAIEATLFGGFGDDILIDVENAIGSAYDDVIYSSIGNNVITGGSGHDTVSYYFAESGVIVNLSNHTASGDGADTLSSIEVVIGSDFADTLTGDDDANVLEGGDGNDTLDGGLGDDVFFGGSGNDALMGGSGHDTVSYAYVMGPVIVSLSNHTASGDGADTLSMIEEVIGSAFADTLTGDSDDNVFSGGDGNDTITGNEGLDIIYGGAGDNTLSGGDSNDTIYGGAGVDTIDGGSGIDLIYAYGGNDTILGGNNSDTIYAGEGDDYVDGQGGGDTIYGEGGNDTLNGGDVNDRIYGGSGNDIIDGEASNDTVDYSLDPAGVTINLLAGTATDGWGNSDTLRNFEHVTASAFADTITGSAGSNVITAGDGNDAVASGDGNDTLSGGAGDDTLSAENGSDTLAGGAGNDTLDGGAGTDTADYSADIAAVTVNMATGTATDGWGGTDSLANFENLTGSAYADALTGSTGSNQINAGAGNDTVYAGSGNDTLTGGTGDDLLYGEAGSDTFISGSGADTYDGSSSTDTLSFASDIAGVTASLASGAATDGWGATDAITGIENLTGSAYADTLTGDSTANTLTGGGGNDTLSGGGSGDALYGGTGADTFLFLPGENGIDTVGDFALTAGGVTGDIIDISDLLTGYTAGVSDITLFARISDDTGNSKVEVDRDGSASTYAFAQVATLQSITGLTDEAALVTSGQLLAA